jgi:signal transduction histidine kinase
MENDRLHAAVKAQLEEVRASRARIVAATDAERRRLERDIHDGAQQRLVIASLAVQRAQAEAGSSGPAVAETLANAADELKLALSELRELARGIHPAILTEEGLGPALESLADRSPVDTVIDSDSIGRLPPPVEATAYFVVSEALANVAKYSRARRATVALTVAHGHLHVEVADDGIGGAEMSNGSGLRGLVDRVAALGGELAVRSPIEGGTRIVAEIPCA